MKPDVRKLSLYIHIPFCKAKCSYCDFLSFDSCGYDRQRQYISALCKEIEAYRTVAGDYLVTTIFIGGGTPSYIEADLIGQVMQSIYKIFKVDPEAEITIEGNPDSLKADKLKTYRQAGINRLSIGLQSANDDMLKTLGRVHDYDQFTEAYNSAREAGFSNINIDIMSGLPGETADSYMETLKKVSALEPEHISAYSLIVEEGTPLSGRQELLELLPSEEEDRMLYAATKERLKAEGYDRYEISNYAKEGFQCRHNIIYWTGGEYLGMGLGAASYLTVWLDDDKCEKIRFHGVEDLDEYIGSFLQCDGIQEDEYTNMYHFYENENDLCGEMDFPDSATEDFSDVDDDYDMYEGMGFSLGMDIGMDGSSDKMEHNIQKYKEYENSALLEFIRDYYKDLYFSKRKDEMEEFMFLGLRLIRGISKAEFKERFGTAIERVYGEVIEKYKERGLLIEQEGRLFLSDKGIDVSNVIMAEFML